MTQISGVRRKRPAVITCAGTHHNASTWEVETGGLSASDKFG